MDMEFAVLIEDKVKARIKELNSKPILFKDMVLTLRDEFKLTPQQIASALIASVGPRQLKEFTKEEF